MVISRGRDIEEGVTLEFGDWRWAEMIAGEREVWRLFVGW